MDALVDNFRYCIHIFRPFMTQSRFTNWRPNSLKQLVLLAFILVVMPLGILLFQASNALVEQSAMGRDLARQSLEISRRGQTMQLLAEDITRAARQYKILAKDEIRLRLVDQLNDYRQLLTIQSFALDESTHIQLIYEHLEKLTDDHFDPDDLILISLTRELNVRLDQALDVRLKELNTVAHNTQNELVIQASILIAMSAILMVFFSRRISRPVLRLGSRIRALGRGERSFGTRIGGPRELVELDEQLDWLSQELEQLESEKQRFLRHMSHELKTPLTTLREGSDLLAEEVAGNLNDSQREIVELLQTNAVQLQSLIEQLLDYNRLGQQEPVQPQKLDLGMLINEALTPHKLLLEQKKIQVCAPENKVYWHSDRAMLLRILSNLISNAAHYGSKGGELSINVSEASDTIMIDVENSGPVIPDEDVPHLFEPFYQGSHKRAGAIKGSGIGLSIAQDAAHALKSELSLHNNRQNKVCFRLALSELST